MNGWAALGAVVLLLAYLALCILAVVYVSIPASLVAASLGAAAGIAAAVVLTGLVVAGVRPARICTPADAVANRIGGRAKAVPGPGDGGWPQYYVRQVWYDLSAGTEDGLRATAALWRGVWQRVPREGLPALAAGVCWPLLLPVPAALAGFTAGMVLALLASTLVFAVVTGFAWAVGAPMCGMLRARDWWLQRRRCAAASCDSCYHVTALPAYQCSGSHADDDSDAIHQDLRPGRRGVMWRRCACGHRIPTGVLRAARRLQARCPMCMAQLPQGAAVVTDIRIPVFGAVNAGKTQLTLAALFALVQEAEQRQIPIAAEGACSVERLQQAGALVDARRAPPPTDSHAAPVVTTLRLRSPTRGPLMHVFDTSGKALADSVRSEEYTFLDDARSLIFVVDPLRLSNVAELLGMRRFEAPESESRAATDPEDSYHVTVNRLRLFGVRTWRQRLAVVVTKADMLERLPREERAAPDSASVRDWLAGHGLDNVMLAAERDFAAVRYFLCSASGASPHEALPPFRWLLAAEGVYPWEERAGVQ